MPFLRSIPDFTLLSIVSLNISISTAEYVNVPRISDLLLGEADYNMHTPCLYYYVVVLTVRTSFTLIQCLLGKFWSTCFVRSLLTLVASSVDMAALGAIVCALAVLGRSGASELPGATQGFATRAVHGGTEPLDDNGAIVPCISLATTFAQTQPGVKRGIGNPNSHGSGFFYSRQANPTRGAFERGLASLESAKHCIAFSSGQAATSAVVSLMSGRTGDHVIALNDLYGGTTAMFQQFADQSSGIDFTYTSLTDLDRVETAITSRTRMIWLETPTKYVHPLYSI